MVWCWLVPERITVISRTESQIAVSGRRLTGKERVAQMTTETRTTKVVTTETTTTIKSEQVQTVLVSDKVGQEYEPHYDLF